MIQYQLLKGKKRKYSVTVYSEYIEFEGRFFYLKEKEFYRSKQRKEKIPLKNFLGIGCLKKRSYKKCLMFVLFGTVLSVLKSITDKIDKMTDKANHYLKFLDYSLNISKWFDGAMYLVLFICLLFGFLYLVSKKNVVEFSFTNKRICVPQRSISNEEYRRIYQVIKSLQEK